MEQRIITLKDAVEFTVKAKESANYRPRYVQSLRNYLLDFAKGREDTPISAITPSDIVEFIDAKGVKPVTRKGIIGRLGALFSHCWRQDFISENPIRKIERVRIDRIEPRILTPGEARRVLDLTHAQHPRVIGYVALCLFAGLRPCEAVRLSWPKIHLERGVIYIDSATSKTRRRRVVELQPAATVWLTLARAHGELCPTVYALAMWRKAVVAALGWDGWSADLLRHSAASYMLALCGDAGKVSTQLGNTAGILMTHYIALTSREEAQEFWSIRPAASSQLELTL